MIIKVQHSSQSLTALDRSGAIGARPFPDDQPIDQALMVPFVMVVHHKFVNALPHGALTEHNHSFQGTTP